MGTDIHVAFEAKIDDAWHFIGSPGVRRNYTFFAHLAGVRGEEGEGIAANRGIPEDASPVTRLLAPPQEYPFHGHSWATLEEVHEALKGAALEIGLSGFKPLKPEELFNWFYFAGEFAPFLNGAPCGINQIRMIFWFDN